MKRSITAALALAAALATGLRAQTAGSADRISVSGGSSVRDWSCDVTRVESGLKVEAAGSQPAVAGLPAGTHEVVVAIPVEGIDCRNGKMNEHLRNALEAEQNPQIRYELTGYELKSDRAVSARGNLTVAGRTTPVVFDAALEPVPGGVRVTGATQLKMTELGVKPPTLMFGSLKVHDDVTIRFDVVLPASGGAFALRGRAD